MNLFWHRRDLRIEDNAGLYYALKYSETVQPIFIFDQNILSQLEDVQDARVTFIHNQIHQLKEAYQVYGGDLEVHYGNPETIISKLIKKYSPQALYTNRDYESYAIQRDEAIRALCTAKGLEFKSYKDHIIFEKEEVLKKDGLPYTVFTPYKRRWLERVESRKKGKLSYYFKPYPTEKYLDSIHIRAKSRLPSLKKMGFAKSKLCIPGKIVPQRIIKKYAEQRDYPSINGTSRLGIHLRFGTISIREKARKAQGLSDTYLSELIWRDFYSQILANFPKVEKSAFRAKYERVPWRNNEAEFELWCKGKTGYPIVDAGIRELNATGHMHNRVRMVVASFLTKHLLIDWRWGEAYFASKLLDFDLASNNGGWQWAAGCGTDAAPYFRIFNPTSQQKKFDQDFKYIKKWIEEWGTDSYPEPMVDHKMARERCLRVYKEALNQDL